MSKIVVDLSGLRKEYCLKELDINNVKPNPIEQFKVWFDEALKSEVEEPNAMVLSTINDLGRPSSRVVLLKGYDSEGFVFFTNYNSRKGNDMINSSYVALNFFWPCLERQVRIEGIASKSSEKDSDDYFSSRPLGSRLGAHVSPQSQEIESRESLEANLVLITKAFEGKDVPRPLNWGGYIVKPEAIEFWQGRPSRLHDRIAYKLNANGEWKKNRLAP